MKIIMLCSMLLILSSSSYAATDQTKTVNVNGTDIEFNFMYITTLTEGNRSKQNANVYYGFDFTGNLYFYFESLNELDKKGNVIGRYEFLPYENMNSDFRINFVDDSNGKNVFYTKDYVQEANDGVSFDYENFSEYEIITGIKKDRVPNYFLQEVHAQFVDGNSTGQDIGDSRGTISGKYNDGNFEIEYNPKTPPPSSGLPGVPLDGGLSILLASGLCYGAYKRRKNS